MSGSLTVSPESSLERCGNREMPSSNLSSLATEGEGNQREMERKRRGIRGRHCRGAVVSLGGEGRTTWARDRGHGRLGGGRRT
jgi:hypothetical protein